MSRRAACSIFWNSGAGSLSTRLLTFNGGVLTSERTESNE
ncbi:hypothetical protein J2X14_000544 [Pantoea alhagi]|nr:hypothetical protein [Pantoea alhagi]